jgi:hypothetical protein
MDISEILASENKGSFSEEFVENTRLQTHENANRSDNYDADDTGVIGLSE